MDAVLENGDYARFGEADSKDRGLELEGNCSFLFGIVPNDDLHGDQTYFGNLSKNEAPTLFCENLGFLPPPTKAR